jgi:hypothetical protein
VAGGDVVSDLPHVLKISFEHVSAIGHPEYYRGDHPCVPASAVPDEHWTRTERTGDAIHEQYNGLLQLIEAGELIRDVQMYETEAVEPIWRDITPGGDAR